MYSIKEALKFCESVLVISEEIRALEKTVHQLPQIENAEYVFIFNQNQRTLFDEQLLNMSSFNLSDKKITENKFFHAHTSYLIVVHVRWSTAFQAFTLLYT